MRLYFVFILFVIVIPLTVYASATSVSVDKSSYLRGETIRLTGSISDYQIGQFVSVQILNPTASDLVQVDAFVPNPDGSFSKKYIADGKKWTLQGKYTIKLFYKGQEFATSFNFEAEQKAKPRPEPKNEEGEPEPPHQSDKKIESPPKLIKKQKPKTHVPGFPALDKAPQYYFDRYYNEAAYRSWFDSQFPGKTIEKVVGYSSTHIDGFPDNSKSPQYYIDRYNSESNYQEWFDSQFPQDTIYTLLGFPNPVTVPEWIKVYADWWSTGQVSDSEFISGIKFMIENDIIIIYDLPESTNSGKEDVPAWFRNNASWWARDLISEDEFVKGIKYLVEEGIIVLS